MRELPEELTEPMTALIRKYEGKPWQDIRIGLADTTVGGIPDVWVYRTNPAGVRTYAKFLQTDKVSVAVENYLAGTSPVDQVKALLAQIEMEKERNVRWTVAALPDSVGQIQVNAYPPVGDAVLQMFDLHHGLTPKMEESIRKWFGTILERS